jgi:Tfp pilus assembly protein PilP
MAQTMRRTTHNLAIGLTLLLASGGTLHAQVNPATVKNQAQNGVNQAQQTQSTAQGQAPAQTQSKPKNPAQSQSQNANSGTAQQTKTPATKPTAGQQPPKKPAATNTTAQNQKNTAQKPAPPKTAPPNHAMNAGPQAKQAQPKPPVKKPEPAATEPKPTPPPARRDPFVTLISKKQGGSGEILHLPPGKPGLQVQTLVIQGILTSPNGMIAVVANPQKSVYFLHVGDELFDGRVEKIEIDGVTFHEVGKDAFGKPLERSVTRKLNPSLGEQP